MVGGHLYGAYHGKKNIHSSSSLLANISKLKSKGFDFFISCGDLVVESEDTNFISLQENVINPLNIEFHNAPGNHDVMNASIYTQYFRYRYYSFRKEKDLYFILDTEETAEGPSDQQFGFFLQELESKIEYNRIFIVSHRMIYSSGSKYKNLVDYSNGDQRNRKLRKSKFFQNLLKVIENQHECYWFSGNVGVRSKSNLFIHYDDVDKIHYIICALSDSEKDVMIEVTVGDEVVFFPIYLGGLKSTFSSLKDWNNHAYFLGARVEKYLLSKRVWFPIIIFLSLLILLVFFLIKKLNYAA